MVPVVDILLPGKHNSDESLKAYENILAQMRTDLRRKLSSP